MNQEEDLSKVIFNLVHSKIINKNKEKAIKASVKISGNLEKELEAYMMEDKPRKVKKAIIRYCL